MVVIASETYATLSPSRNLHPLTGVVAETSKLATESNADEGESVQRNKTTTTSFTNIPTTSIHETGLTKQQGVTQPSQVRRSDIGKETTQPICPSKGDFDETTILFKRNKEQQGIKSSAPCGESKGSRDATSIFNNDNETFCKAIVEGPITTLFSTKYSDVLATEKIQRNNSSCLRDATPAAPGSTTTRLSIASTSLAKKAYKTEKGKHAPRMLIQKVARTRPKIVSRFHLAGTRFDVTFNYLSGLCSYFRRGFRADQCANGA